MLAVAATGTMHAQAPAAAPQASTANDAKAPRFKFNTEVHDFGTVKEGPLAEYVFKFKNVGKKPLIINNAIAPCGCTTP